MRGAKVERADALLHAMGEVIRGHQRSSEIKRADALLHAMGEAVRGNESAIQANHLKAVSSRAINGNYLKAEQALVNLGALNPRLLICMLRIGRALGAREIDQR